MPELPKGLRAKKHYLKDRADEIFDAMARYSVVGKEIPQHWIIEYIDIKLKLDE